MEAAILFVDDEPQVLSGLRRMLYPLRGRFEMLFAGSGQAALEVMGSRAVDVVVTDMRMPGMSGAELLREVKRRYPQVLRVVLSGDTGAESVVEAVGAAHQYLSKPCDLERLTGVLEGALRARAILADPQLQELVTSVESLPTLPAVYNRVLAELKRESSSTKTLGAIIASDVALSADVLRIVNSSFFGFVRRVTSPEQAVSLLGINVIRSLILSSHIFSALSPGQLREFSLRGLWDHSMRVSQAAACVAEVLGASAAARDEAFVAGLLHDVGKLVLAVRFKSRFGEVLAMARAGNRRFWNMEKEMFAITHAEVGAYLMGVWGLPAAIVDAIARHHEPSAAGERSLPLAALHVANVLDHRLVVLNEGYERPELDTSFLEKAGLAERMPGIESKVMETLERMESHEAQDSDR